MLRQKTPERYACWSPLCYSSLGAWPVDLENQWGSGNGSEWSLVDGLEHFLFFRILETIIPTWLSYFSEGLKPPTRSRNRWWRRKHQGTSGNIRNMPELLPAYFGSDFGTGLTHAHRRILRSPNEKILSSSNLDGPKPGEPVSRCLMVIWCPPGWWPDGDTTCWISIHVLRIKLPSNFDQPLFVSMSVIPLIDDIRPSTTVTRFAQSTEEEPASLFVVALGAARWGTLRVALPWRWVWKWMNVGYCTPQDCNFNGENLASPLDSGESSFTHSQLALDLAASVLQGEPAGSSGRSGRFWLSGGSISLL